MKSKEKRQRMSNLWVNDDNEMKIRAYVNYFTFAY